MKASIHSALTEGFTEPVRDSLWGHIYLTPALEALTRSEPFMRLHRILQLGPAYQVYPGATHTRASHSIGVYHLCRRLLIHLAEKGADGWLTFEGAVSFLCAGLLHDLGHFPYTHSLKELPLKEHETLTGEIILSEPLSSLIAAAGGSPELSAAIVDRNLAVSGEEPVFYRKLLSGVLDPDKLDYLNRDAQYCGVPYGAQDVDFILSRLYPDREQGIVIDSGGIPSVESLLFSKYLMYRAVYWHHSVRSATAMIKKALLWGLAEGKIAGEELYNLDDQGLFALMKSRGGDNALSLAAKVRSGRLFTPLRGLPFDEKLHAPLLPAGERARYEEDLAGELSRSLGMGIKPGELIIDIPEKVSFETSLFVSDENRGFEESSSAFKANLVEALVKSLRIIRVFIDPCHNFEVKSKPEQGAILQIIQKWLHY
jgi:HD superfamily phosphohydrolase